MVCGCMNARRSCQNDTQMASVDVSRRGSCQWWANLKYLRSFWHKPKINMKRLSWKTARSFPARKSSKIVKSFQMSQQRSALDCIRCSSASIDCSCTQIRSSSTYYGPTCRKQPLRTGRWSRNTEKSNVSLWSFDICDFQIESQKFESNRKSNHNALNRIFYCQIVSLIAVKSRFKSNRDSDLPTAGNYSPQAANSLNRQKFRKLFKFHVFAKLATDDDVDESQMIRIFLR